LRPFLAAAAFSLILGSTVTLSCQKEPSEDEIVIRAQDFEGTIEPDTQRQMVADTAGLSTPQVEIDTSTATDSFPSDSAALDSLPPPVAGEGWRTIAVEVRSSLYTSLAHVMQSDSLGSGATAEVLGAHCSRCMWWDMDPWDDLIAGDSLYVVYTDSLPDDFENRVVALRYVPVAGSENRAFSVYRFRRTGDNYPSYWYADGTEVPILLDAMPVSTFEEVTGVFGEPRSGHSHAGVDFKAPVGTPVRSGSGGTVSRTDWNTDYNGHCVEVDMGGGYSQIFIHLDRLAEGLRVGASVEPGGLVGYVGNTGRSYAPHLHYQINDRSSGYPVDPYIFHGCHRRSLPEGDMDGFAELRDRCDRLMEGEG